VTGEPRAKAAPRPVTDERAHEQDVLGLAERERDALLAWVSENLTVVRKSASGERVLYWSLGIGFVVGLAAHIGGFLLKTWETTEPLSLMGDLLYTLGWALWTGAVVVVFTQVYPETKRRQYKQALDAYEAASGDQAGAWNRRNLPGAQGKADQSVQWYRRAADGGDADAMFNLGALLAEGGEEDQAAQWYRKAADAGNADAMFNLGALLAGQGEQDEAAQWYRKAADAGRRSGRQG
jgi:tetratricopeptide (TPR) repeat protein